MSDASRAILQADQVLRLTMRANELAQLAEKAGVDLTIEVRAGKPVLVQVSEPAKLQIVPKE